MTDLADIDVRGAGLPPFDAAAFVDELLAAGCSLSPVIPVGPDDLLDTCAIVARVPKWLVHPGLDRQPTPAEAAVVARWGPAIAACPNFQAHVLEVVRTLVEERRHDI